MCWRNSCIRTSSLFPVLKKDQTNDCLLISKLPFALGSSITAGKNFSRCVKDAAASVLISCNELHVETSVSLCKLLKADGGVDIRHNKDK